MHRKCFRGVGQGELRAKGIGQRAMLPSYKRRTTSVNVAPFGNLACAILVPIWSFKLGAPEVALASGGARSPMHSLRQCTGASTTGRHAPIQAESPTVRTHQHSALPSLSRLRSVYRLEAASSAARAQSRYPQRQLLSRCQPHCIPTRGVQCSAVSATWDVSERPAPKKALQRAAVFTAAFTIWFCVNWLTRPAAAVASATSALTSTGASKAGDSMYQLAQLSR